jgi:ATP phosphoribosyltransferase
LFLRDDDIPGYVEDGVADLGVIGLNVLMENKKQVNIIKELGFSKCRLSLAIPRNEVYTGLEYFQGKSIATSYPNLTNEFLLSHGIKAETHEISGSVEIAPSIGLAEGICDIVSTGGTLLSNGLKEVAEVYKSQAALISSQKLSDEKKNILAKLLFRIDSVQRGQNAKYVVLNTKEENVNNIISLLPGMKSPSILPLAEKGWISMHSVISENDFWDIIDKLRNAGAEGILVLPIEKMIL